MLITGTSFTLRYHWLQTKSWRFFSFSSKQPDQPTKETTFRQSNCLTGWWQMCSSFCCCPRHDFCCEQPTLWSVGLLGNRSFQRKNHQRTSHDNDLISMFSANTREKKIPKLNKKRTNAVSQNIFFNSAAAIEQRSSKCALKWFMKTRRVWVFYHFTEQRLKHFFPRL